jgi:hypothetical protein
VFDGSDVNWIVKTPKSLSTTLAFLAFNHRLARLGLVGINGCPSGDKTGTRMEIILE